MAYKNGKRTVYCRQCYQVGHNRRGCPTLSPELKAMYKNGDRARKCSYCSEKGHTKRKCEKRTKDIAEYAAENKKYRKAYLEAMVQHGLSIGSLVTHMGVGSEKPLDEIRPEYIGMVTHIEWNDIQYRRRSNLPIKASRLGEQENIYNSDMWLGCPPIASEDYESWATCRGRCQVLSRRNDIMSHVPAGWLDGMSGVDRFF